MTSIGPTLVPEAQDMRSVVPIDLTDVDPWLFGPVEQAAGLVRVLRVAVFDAGPM
jgi:hypothetical protein